MIPRSAWASLGPRDWWLWGRLVLAEITCSAISRYVEPGGASRLMRATSSISTSCDVTEDQGCRETPPPRSSRESIFLRASVATGAIDRPWRVRGVKHERPPGTELSVLDRSPAGVSRFSLRGTERRGSMCRYDQMVRTYSRPTKGDCKREIAVPPRGTAGRLRSQAALVWRRCPHKRSEQSPERSPSQAGLNSSVQ